MNYWMVENLAEKILQEEKKEDENSCRHHEKYVCGDDAWNDGENKTLTFPYQ